MPQADLDHELEVQVALMNNDPKKRQQARGDQEEDRRGKMKKFYRGQLPAPEEFVRSDLFSGTVEAYIADAAKKLGGSVKFVDAVHFITGEGIEKKEEDFAAEVAAQMNAGKN